ncbi:hypothetical protein LAJ60_02450 [Bartonella taylorii]|uniref:Uncharacterized protein n=1 Tax=Bartonella taylorii TaxID=33046 RepID=A0A9Q8YYD1_BARTA|nr:hypothetical protein [Bartonella taylorii]USP03316.1 hypothetical protein LAJ60_02450 [Bartonella taylorii]
MALLSCLLSHLVRLRASTSTHGMMRVNLPDIKTRLTIAMMVIMRGVKQVSSYQSVPITKALKFL